jgi:hypothetical protein
MVVGVLLEVPPLFLCDMCEGDLATTPAGLSGKTAEFFSRQNFAPSPIHDHGRYQRHGGIHFRRRKCSRRRTATSGVAAATY